jgi:hypothetical protein
MGKEWMGHSDAYYGPKAQLANRKTGKQKNSLQWARGSVRRGSGFVQIAIALKIPHDSVQ